MKTALCYFSGTGNCLAVTRDLAERAGADIIAIPEVLSSPSRIDKYETIGIVFPVYLAPLSGVPLIVERFVRVIPEIGVRRLFGVCTSGGYEIVNAVPGVRSLARYVRSRGGRLAAEYTVRLPMNNLEYDHIPVPIERDSDVIIGRSKARIDEIARRIQSRRGGRRQAIRKVINALFAPMRLAMRKPVVASLRGYAKVGADSNLSYRELIPLTDRSIVVDEHCVNCGICAKVCPVGNIEMTNQGPVYQGRCEMCFACDEWCPHDAIHHWSRADGVKYHHPEVKAGDMFRPKRRT